MAKAKTINILLGDGTLDGLVTVEDSSWEGILLIAPRDKIDELFCQEETRFWGVYILVSDNEVYIGQASELQKRIKQHSAGFEFWEKAILITTKDDSLNKSAIDYIETDLIEKAKNNSKLHFENKKSGNKQKVNRFDKVKLDNYIENTLLLLELLGIYVFAPAKQQNSSTRKRTMKVKNSVSELSNPNENSGQAAVNLADGSLKIGKYVQGLMHKLAEDGFTFSQDQIDNLTSKEWSHTYLGLHYPLLKIKTGDINDRLDSKGRCRYYADVYTIGGVDYYLTSQLFDRGNFRTKFDIWYRLL